jgi:hypothetical protein
MPLERGGGGGGDCLWLRPFELGRISNGHLQQGTHSPEARETTDQDQRNYRGNSLPSKRPRSAICASLSPFFLPPRFRNGHVAVPVPVTVTAASLLKPPRGAFRIELEKCPLGHLESPMAGLDRKGIFCVLADTLPVVTAVACFLSAHNMGSLIAARRQPVFYFGEVTSRPIFIFIEPIRSVCVRLEIACGPFCGPFCFSQSYRRIEVNPLAPWRLYPIKPIDSGVIIYIITVP